MEAFSFFAVMVCAQGVASDSAITSQLYAKLPLHQHPTLVRMLDRSNELRKSVGLRAHRINPRLTQAAQDHARYMARTGSFGHYSNGGPQGRAQKYKFGAGVYENIAMGQRTVHAAFHAWQISSGHWTAITSNTTDAGFGYAISKDGRQYWVGVYGTPPPEQTKAPEQNKVAEPVKVPVTPVKTTTTPNPKQ